MSGSRGHPFSWQLSFSLDNPLRRFLYPPKKVIEKLDVKAEDIVIDFGCGPGFYTIPFAKKAKRVIGIDVQNKMLEKAFENAKKENVRIELYQSDGKNVPLPDSIADLIFLCWVLHELDDKQVVLKELKRLLNKNGRLAIMEKTKRRLRPIGPPVVRISEIANSIQNVGLEVCSNIKIGNETIVIGRFKSSV